MVTLLGGLGWLDRHERERREEVERQLSEHKHDTYVLLINIFLEVMKAAKKGIILEPDTLVDRMHDLQRDLFLYGSDEVLKTYLKWQRNSTQGQASFGLLGEIIIAIRKDMGTRHTKVTLEDLLRLWINDYADAKGKGLIA